MNFFSKLFRSRDKPQNLCRFVGWPFMFGKSAAGQNVNEFTAMQTMAVYACVRILAESIAGLPLHVYEYRGNGKERVPEHPLYFLLHDSPNPEMTSFIFRETAMIHLLLWGNSYAQILRDGRGRVVGLYPLLPNRMSVERNDAGEIIYTYTPMIDANPNFKDKGQIRLRKEDVLHILGLGFDGLVGYSPIAMAKNAIGIALATEEYGAAFFRNGARPGGVLEHPGVLKDPSKLRESWHAVYGGAMNTGRIAVLEEGVKYQQIAIPPEEAQFLETRKFQIDEIARLYRVPPHMIGDLEKSSFNNIEQQSLEFVKYTLNPWVVRWEQSLQKALLSEKERKEYFIRFKVDGLLRGDYKSRMEGYAIGRQNGWLSANDIRSLEDINPIEGDEGGDLYLINGSMTKLKDAGLFANKQQWGKMMKRKFWNWVRNEGEKRTLLLDGEISDEAWFGDEVTPAIFREELHAAEGDVVLWINSPGGDCFAAAQIYNMLMDYPGNVTVRIDSLAASAASVIAMAGSTVEISPVGMILVHNPMTISIGDVQEMERAIALLAEVKESIINAYEIKTGMSRSKISRLMDAETWMNAKKAVELGFADAVLTGEKNRPTSDEADGLIFSHAAVTNSLLSKFGQGKQMNKVDAESLKKRLFSIAH